MQVFKAFFHIANKRKHAAIIYIGIYAAITILLALTGQDSYNDNFKTSALSVSIADEDNSIASCALTNHLSSIHEVSTDTGDKNYILDQIYYRWLDYSLTIPAGFEEKLLAGETEELVSKMAIPGSTKGQYVDWQITQYLQTLQLYIKSGYTLNDAIEQTNTSISSTPEVSVLSFHADDSHVKSDVFYYFQYMPYILIAILFTGMAPILITMNANGLKERTACSSLPSGKRIGQLALGCILYSLTVWLIFILIYFLIYRADAIQMNTLYAMINSFAFLLFSTATTLLVSCFAPNDNILNMLANIIGLGMSFLCGVFVPQSMLSDSVLNVGKFLPAYWYIRANNMLGGFGKEVFDMKFYWICIGVQLLFSAAIFAVTLVFSRQKQRK